MKYRYLNNRYVKTKWPTICDWRRADSVSIGWLAPDLGIHRSGEACHAPPIIPKLAKQVHQAPQKSTYHTHPHNSVTKMEVRDKNSQGCTTIQLFSKTGA